MSHEIRSPGAEAVGQSRSRLDLMAAERQEKPAPRWRTTVPLFRVSQLRSLFEG